MFVAGKLLHRIEALQFERSQIGRRPAYRRRHVRKAVGVLVRKPTPP
jgi:hypothetical protein